MHARVRRIGTMNTTAYDVAAQYDRVCLVWLTGLPGPFMNL